MQLDRLFENPTAPYRGKPFWSWNGKLEPEEIRRQLRVFRDMGMGGAFLHSRVGLDSEYLGKEWFDAIRAGVEECAAYDMEAWLYDEDRWPSGSAGGLATEKKAYRMLYMVMEIIPATKFRWEKETLAAWEAELFKSRVLSMKRLKKGARPSKKPGTSVLAFQVQPMPESTWYNGNTYLNTLSPEAVAHFIDITHEAYKREIGEHFGKTVKGIFTDEPSYSCFVRPSVPLGRKGIPYTFLPWRKDLFKVFKEEYGYDLKARLPELFLQVEGKNAAKPRLDYRNLITSIYDAAFAKQCADWCERNNIALTGHVLLEGQLYAQTLVEGSSMRFYEQMQLPGIDMLGQFNPELDSAKQCQSVVNQTGKKWLLSELYGCTGWDFSFEGHKAVGDWQTALGVNLRCHHLSWYTMLGEAKRDYPASIFFQSPWWEHYRFVEDYYARINLALTQGEYTQKLLVLHPLETMFARFRPRWVDSEDPLKLMVAPIPGEDIQEVEDMLPTLRNWLLESHVDFDYGDEDMLARLGKALKGKGGPRMKLGRAEYSTVLVPPLDTIRSSTLKMLEKFVQAGGRVIFSGEPPELVDGEPNPVAWELAEKCERVPFERAPLVGEVEKTARLISVQDEKGREIPEVLFQMRRDGQKTICFLCNTHRGKQYDNAIIRLQGKGKVVEYDAERGKKERIPCRQKDDWVEFSTTFYPTGSRLFVVDPSPAKGIPLQKTGKVSHSDHLGKPRLTQLSEPNVLVLDRPRYRLNEKGGWKKAMDVLKLDQKIREEMGWPYRGGEMLQPWARKDPKNPPAMPVELEYRFQVEKMPRGMTELVMELPEKFEVWFNGFPVSKENSPGWWVDPCLKRLPLEPACWQKGENVLRLKTRLIEREGLESLFILGHFGVQTKGTELTVVEMPERLDLGDWTRQAMPFYSGAVAYRFQTRPRIQKGQRLILSAPFFKGAVTRVLVNGQPAGYLAWAPYELDLTDFYTGEEMELTLEVFGSRRNSFGPLHQKDLNPINVGPRNFITEGPDWLDGYGVKPCGLLESPEWLVWSPAKK